MAKAGKIQTYIEYLAARTVIGVVGIFPLAWSMKFGKFLGRTTFRLAGKLRRVGRRNLEIAMPDLSEAEKDKIVAGCFESLGRQLGVVSHFPHFTAESIREFFEIEGLEHFQKAHATGNGLLFFTAHFGAWEVFNLVAPIFFGCPSNILVRRVDNPLVENYVEKLRTRFGSKTVDKKASARTMFRILKKGELLGVAADLNVQEHEGIFVDFFGVPASTTTSVAKLAIKTDAIILPCFAVWDEAKKRYVLRFEPFIKALKTNDEETETLRLTQNITTIVEKYAREFPEQWMWIHKRWNTRPEGEKGLYS